MSAAQDRLAAIIAEHALYADGVTEECKCEWDPDYDRVDFSADSPIPAHEQVTMQHAAHVAAVIAGAADLAVIAKPDAKNPTPALIEAAYIAQDDLSKPPEPWLIESTAEIIDAYIEAQGHEKVHVIGHDAAVRAAAEAVSDRG